MNYIHIEIIYIYSFIILNIQRLMKSVIVLGNGFDIDLGLKTSFSEFINSYEFRSLSDIPLIVYIRKKFEDEPLWCDIEGTFRVFLSSPLEDSDKVDINLAWQSITRAWEKYILNITRKDHVKINRNSCAYAFLSQIKSSDNWFSFNYTSPFYLSGLGDDYQHFVHNFYVPEELQPFNGVQLIQKNLIIGVDSTFSESILGDEKLVPIIKKQNHFYNDVHLVESLFNADNIVIYGHSLGITDSDYFKPLFDGILSNELTSKNIYIVTYTEECFEKIKDNMKSYNIDYDSLSRKATIIPIYTINGPKDNFFKALVSLLVENE